MNAAAGKAGHVTHHAAPKGKQHGLSVTRRTQKGIEDPVQRLPKS